MLMLGLLFRSRVLPHGIEDDKIENGRTAEHIDNEGHQCPVVRLPPNLARTVWNRNVENNNQPRRERTDDDREDNLLRADQQDAERTGRVICV
jgi:hypothetical protein